MENRWQWKKNYSKSCIRFLKNRILREFTRQWTWRNLHLLTNLKWVVFCWPVLLLTLIFPLLKPVVEGTFHSRFGVFIGLPFYLNYSVEVDDRQADFDVFLRHFGLDKEQLTDCNDDGKSVLEQLQDCLELSSQARRFILLSSLYAASTPVDPFLNTAALAMVPFAGYSLYRRQFKRQNSVALNVFVFSGYLMACASIYVMKFLQQRYGSWATFSFECEGEDSDTARAELRKGATEYLQKLSKLQEIVDKYSTSAQKSLWSDYQVYTAKRRLADLEVFSKKDCPITSILLWLVLLR